MENVFSTKVQKGKGLWVDIVYLRSMLHDGILGELKRIPDGRWACGLLNKNVAKIFCKSIRLCVLESPRTASINGYWYISRYVGLNR